MDGDAEEGEEADAGGDAEVGVGEEEGERAADGGHEDRAHDEQGPLERAEHDVEDEEDANQRDRNDNCQAGVGALLALVFAGPLGVVSGGQFHSFVDLVDGFLNG